MNPPFLKALCRHQRIFLVGAGGGFDIFSGIPLFEYLSARGKDVWLGSLSFSELKDEDGQKLRTDYLEVRPDTPGDENYFPERYLSQWYADHGREVPVYSFYGSGARTILTIFSKLKRSLNFDAMVLVDGGTDSLMRGDEPGLGSPAEDVASIAAAHMLEGVDTYLVNLGFGVDFYHGVCHAYVLEAIADLTKSGDFLGAFSLLPGMPEFETFCQITDYTNERMAPNASIVASSIRSAGKGEFGDHHHIERTEGQELFINPLMSLYWCFKLKGVAERCLYLDYIKDTHSRMDVHRALSNYLYTVKPREWKTFPH